MKPTHAQVNAAMEAAEQLNAAANKLVEYWKLLKIASDDAVKLVEAQTAANNIVLSLTKAWLEQAETAQHADVTPPSKGKGKVTDDDQPPTVYVAGLCEVSVSYWRANHYLPAFRDCQHPIEDVSDGTTDPMFGTYEIWAYRSVAAQFIADYREQNRKRGETFVVPKLDNLPICRIMYGGGPKTLYRLSFGFVIK